MTRPDLFAADPGPPLDALRAEGERLSEARKAVALRITPSEETAPAAFEGNGVDSPLLVRGSAKSPGPVVPRRFLEALAGDRPIGVTRGSGRLALARQLTDPDNPFATRVIVNRVWHHLFGRGLVASVDNFGVLGEPPTHPALLDHLAGEFARQGWSLKACVRSLVLTRAYRMSSRPGPDDSLDPENVWLHRMPIRRLEAEAVRDAILAASGRLDGRMFGPPVRVHLTPYMQGRGRPADSGPLDGEGRRSLYQEARRNFPIPMMLAFDVPTPFTTIGRRNVSNVPAQALILLNDPFVVGQADAWAGRILADAGRTGDQRISVIYRDAFARPPTGAGADLGEIQADAISLADAVVFRHDDVIHIDAGRASVIDDDFADRIIDESGEKSGAQSETRQSERDVVLPAADVNFQRRCEFDPPVSRRTKSDHALAEAHEIEGGIGLWSQLKHSLILKDFGHE